MGVSPRHVVHVRHLLRVPPPVGPGAALVIGGRAEVHRGHIDHVAIEILQGAVLRAAAVPTQLRVCRWKSPRTIWSGLPSTGAVYARIAFRSAASAVWPAFASTVSSAAVFQT